MWEAWVILSKSSSLSPIFPYLTHHQCLFLVNIEISPICSICTSILTTFLVKLLMLLNWTATNTSWVGYRHPSLSTLMHFPTASRETYMQSSSTQVWICHSFLNSIPSQPRNPFISHPIFHNCPDRPHLAY